MELSGRRAVVTGAASGIGRAIAAAFSTAGADVVIADIDAERATETASELGTNGRLVHAVPADVSRATDVQRLMDQAAGVLGGVDLLVNNAGIVVCGPVDEFSDEDWARTLDVNAKGVFLCVKHALAELRRSPAAAIVNVASIAALKGGPGTTAYAASKGAVVAMTRQLSRELAPDAIRVNCVCPGWIDTPFNAPAVDYMGGPQELAALVDEIPLKRMGAPAEVASTVVFLASEAASFMTGRTLVVDGGLV